MSLSMAEIRTVVRDLAPRLRGGRIERIDQPQEYRLVLTVRNAGCLYWLLLSAHPQMSRIHLLTRRPERTPPAAGLCNVLRQHMTGAPLRALRQVERDRVVLVESAERDRMMRSHPITLVAELTGLGSNLILLDESEHVLGCLTREDSSRRKLFMGAQYPWLTPPDRLPEQAYRDRFADCADPADPLGLSRAIEAHYAPLTPLMALPSDRLWDEVAQANQPTGVLALGTAPETTNSHVQTIVLPSDPESYVRGFYAALRSLDRAKLARLYVEAPPRDAAWLAVWNRLERAVHGSG